MGGEELCSRCLLLLGGEDIEHFFICYIFICLEGGVGWYDAAEWVLLK